MTFLHFFGISKKNFLGDPTVSESTLLHAADQARNHYLDQRWSHSLTPYGLTYLPLEKWPHLAGHNFKCKVWFEFPKSPIGSIGSGNGLAPNRRQASNWTNADPIQWRIYAALGRRSVKLYNNALHKCLYLLDFCGVISSTCTLTIQGTGHYLNLASYRTDLASCRKLDTHVMWLFSADPNHYVRVALYHWKLKNWFVVNLEIWFQF